MTTSDSVQKITVADEFKVCTVCGYDMGFHVSFQKDIDVPVRLLLICPDCGARFDVGWTANLPKN
ncbi:hypothetical protein CEE37_12375 [candidate division LCP-89 bacterium B3_LCP]|uniref:Uncharacterized protein n=1 Tax=candidate division LCP-89 bacterium B3_LCP TaxID=2012998 RepID=A0A532UUD2_UNCL8|nr:MAG: hypothetical protein CEE37_12375 [candidate division LCP-89 bacterium B3_LCP]